LNRAQRALRAYPVDAEGEAKGEAGAKVAFAFANATKALTPIALVLSGEAGEGCKKLMILLREGWMSEWLKESVLKTGVLLIIPGVRIPLHP